MTQLPGTLEELRADVSKMISGQLMEHYQRGTRDGLETAVKMVQAMLDTGEPNEPQIAVLRPLRDGLIKALGHIREPPEPPQLSRGSMPPP